MENRFENAINEVIKSRNAVEKIVTSLDEFLVVGRVSDKKSTMLKSRRMARDIKKSLKEIKAVAKKLGVDIKEYIDASNEISKKRIIVVGEVYHE